MATMHDIAKHAGVSIATVSRVFNQHKDVRENTRRHVLEAAEALNYRPHVSARNLRRHQSGQNELKYTIGFVFVGSQLFLESPFFTDLAASVEQALRERGFRVLIITASPEGGIPFEIEVGDVDGVICSGEGTVVEKIAHLTPTVTLDMDNPHSEAYAVIPDYRSGVCEATRRLLNTGHRRIVLLTPRPTRSEGMRFNRQVMDGCLKAYADAGLQPPHDLFPYTALITLEGYKAGLALFSDPSNRPDAIIGSDGLMLGVYRAAYECHLRICENISLIGIDGITKGEFYPPPLTTVDTHLRESGSTAVNILIDQIVSGERRRGLEITKTNLLERASARI